MNKINEKLSKFIVNSFLYGGGTFILGFFAYYAYNQKIRLQLNGPILEMQKEIPFETLKILLIKIKEKFILVFSAYFDKCPSFVNSGISNNSQINSDIIINTLITGEASRKYPDVDDENFDLSKKQEFSRLIESIIL